MTEPRDPRPIVLPSWWQVREAELELELFALRKPAESRWWAMDPQERRAAAFDAAEFRVWIEADL